MRSAAWVDAMDGQVSAVAEIGGTVDEMSVDTHVRVSPVRVGNALLPASELDVRLDPTPQKLHVIGHTKCGQPITAPFDRAEYDADKLSGIFHVDGELFGGQVAFNDLSVTRQRKKTVRGDIAFNKLDVGALAELSPVVALSDTKPKGRLSGSLHIDDMPLEHAADTRATARLGSLWLSRGGFKVELQRGARPLEVGGGHIQVPGLALAVTTPSGQRGVFDLDGGVTGLGKKPVVDTTLALRPADLSGFIGLIPRAERASGTLQGKLRVTGPPSALRYQGGFSLENGEVSVRGLPSTISDIQLAVKLDNDELSITRGRAHMGDGTIQLSGSAPLRGLDLGAARGVHHRAAHPPAHRHRRQRHRGRRPGRELAPCDRHRRQRRAPRATARHRPGHAALVQVHAPHHRNRRHHASSPSAASAPSSTRYDPADDTVDFDITLLAPQPLKIENNLVDAELSIGRDGLMLAGTNQRVGMRGTLKLKPGGRIRLRRNEFEIRQGFVRFDDLTRIAPQVDVTAVTDYHRYSASINDTGGGSGASASAAAGSAATATSARGGQWHIKMHAYGDADKLRIDLTSEPQLAQDDIFLLLTVGLTRAELDQAQSASVGESVALEALGTLTGADKAVTEALPVIDEFRFGSAYSSRTGRTEPTVTIGKRLADRIRANVTSGLSDSREVRSNVEWQLSPRVSVEGSYDNVNDISSSSLGNLGADIRWRLEFE